MSTLGGRLGHAARRRLGGDGLRASYRIATCAADGIAVATGCSQGDGTLSVVDAGEHRLILDTTDSRRAVVVVIRPETLTLAATFRDFDNALEAQRATLAPEELQLRLAERERRLDELLFYLCGAPEEQLLRFESPSDLPEMDAEHA